MDWKDVPTPFDPVRLWQRTPFPGAKLTVMQVRQKFWGFFGVFTEDSRKLTLKNKPSSSL